MFVTSTVTVAALSIEPTARDGAMQLRTRGEMKTARTNVVPKRQLSDVEFTKFEPRTKTACCPVANPRAGVTEITDASS